MSGDISKEAVEAALDGHSRGWRESWDGTIAMREALTAALPHIPAVNAHDDLVAALKDIERGKNSLADAELVQHFQATARAALAKAAQS